MGTKPRKIVMWGARCVLVLATITLAGCSDLAIRDVASLFAPTLQRSEIVGFLAGLGTTLAAVPDLMAMLKKRSSAGMNPRMAAITCLAQVVWIYYGLLIGSRPVIAWNVIAVVINGVSVAAYLHFAAAESRR
jgi:MtN3 and saliva related transmembrane protein